MKKNLGGIIASFLLSCLFFNVSADISTDFGVIFQRPSYIVELDNLKDKQLTESGSIYHCDEGKDECKVNLKIVEPDLTNLSTKLECRIDFGFQSDQGEKCNPNTVIFPEGRHEVAITVWEKKNPNNISRISYIFLNRYKSTIIEKSQEVYSQEFQPKFSYFMSDEASIAKNRNPHPPSGTSPLQEEEDIDESIHFDYIFQRPSYITGTGGIYICESYREECKVNLKLLDKKTSKDISSNFSCSIDFGFTSDQSHKCNPNTVIVPKGNHVVVFRVYEKDNSQNYTTKTISIDNTSQLVPHNMNQKQTGTNQIQSTYLKTQIIIQSKNSNNRTIYSDKIVCFDIDTCNINLDSISQTSGLLKDISYNWDFGNGQYSNKQNPLGVWYAPGKYRVVLTASYSDRYQDTSYVDIIVGEKTQSVTKQNNLHIQKKTPYYLRGRGLIQSKDSKNRTVYKNKIICSGVQRCNVNLNSEVETNGVKSHLYYYWNFGNGEYSHKANPSGIWYTPGEYHVELTISDNHGNRVQDVFHISVLQDEKLLSEQLPDTLLLKQEQLLSLSGSLVIGYDLVDEINIEKIKKPRFSQSIKKQKKSLKIYGKTLPSIIIYIYFGDKKYEIISNEKGNYALKLKYLQPGKYTIVSQVVLSDGTIYEIPRIKSIELSPEYISDMNERNNKIYQSKIKKITKKIKQKITLKAATKKELSIIPKTHAGSGDEGYNSAINFKLLNMLLAIMGVLMIYLVLRRWRII